jgi:hypothetical protein
MMTQNMVLEAACDPDFSCFLHLAGYDFLYYEKIFISWPIFSLQVAMSLQVYSSGPLTRKPIP